MQAHHGSWSLKAPDVSDGDELLPPPPASVAEAIPDFHLHGDHNCGHHQHDIGSRRFAKYRKRQRAGESTTPTLGCFNCHTRRTLDQLHDLPCGDLICRECVLVKALIVKLEIDRNHEHIQDAREQMIKAARFLSGSPDINTDERQLLTQHYDQLRQSIVRMSGLTCCGVDMDLDRFIPCLGPAVSRGLWLALRWAYDEPSEQRACAWPDCGGYLPVCSRYQLPGDCGRRWHCVSCRGNSMDCARTLETTQTRFPFLPRGHPALTPAMSL